MDRDAIRIGGLDMAMSVNENGGRGGEGMRVLGRRLGWSCPAALDRRVRLGRRGKGSRRERQEQP